MVEQQYKPKLLNLKDYEIKQTLGTGKKYLIYKVLSVEYV